MKESYVKGLANHNGPESCVEWRDSLGQNTDRALDRANVQSALGRIRQAAVKDKKAKFTSLMHHIYNLSTLREAYYGLKREAAAGVDGETWRQYGENLESNLADLS